MPYEFDYTVFIGRFQPPHLSHIELMKIALEQSKELIILAGSSMQPRTIRNPWTWMERDEMIRAAIPHELHDRTIVMPLHDVMYNDQKWTQSVQNIVDGIAGDNKKVAMIGHSKDDTSYYLKLFPQWTLFDVDIIEDLHAANIRNLYLNPQADEMNFDSIIGQYLPKPIHDYLQAFMLTEHYEKLTDEFMFIQNYKRAWEKAPYQPTFVTVDTVVIQSGHVLLIRRRAEPGKGLWALPGGFLNPSERIEDGAIRELREETKIKVPAPVLRGSIKRSKVFDHPGRSLRGRTITHAHLIELSAGELPKIKGSDDADKAKWIPLNVFNSMENQLFEDHYHIVNDMIGV
jgi:bifunctional NMN adenylyltransferase/nudix hydrolase